jgi:hypothetical protein
VLWREVLALFDAVAVGNPAWGVPAYNGGLFTKLTAGVEPAKRRQALGYIPEITLGGTSCLGDVGRALGVVGGVQLCRCWERGCS